MTEPSAPRRPALTEEEREQGGECPCIYASVPCYPVCSCHTPVGSAPCKCCVPRHLSVEDKRKAADWVASYQPALYIRTQLEAAHLQLTAIRESASAFLAKYDECEPHITNAFVMAYTVRGGTYTGPNFTDELKALRDCVSGPPPAQEGTNGTD